MNLIFIDSLISIHKSNVLGIFSGLLHKSVPMLSSNYQIVSHEQQITASQA